MKIAFVLKKITISDPLGIMYLSSAIKEAGHEAELVCFDNEKYLLGELKKIKPDVVAYSVTTGAHNEYVAINKAIKRHMDVYSIFGGPHPTFYPEIIEEEGIDAICIGEGEQAFVEFINKLEKGDDITKVKNFWVKQGGKIAKNPVRDLIQDLDQLPFPDRDLIYQKDKFFLNFNIKRFMAGRGCPYRCSYCFNRSYNEMYSGKGKIVRLRSVDNLLAEIKEVRAKYPLKAVKFVDDTFIISPAWLKEFCEKYKKEIGLPFVCNIRADLTTPEIVRQLKDANCKVVYMGIESGNEKTRREILNKFISDEQILNACKLLRKNKIKLITQNMLGLPGETVKDSFKTVLFNSKCKATLPAFSMLQPYPNTAISNYAIENGFFDGNFDKLSRNNLSSTALNYSPNEKRQLENLLKLSIMTARLPLLAPLVKFLIKLPRNKIYDTIYVLSYGLSQASAYFMISGSYSNITGMANKVYHFFKP